MPPYADDGLFVVEERNSIEVVSNECGLLEISVESTCPPIDHDQANQIPFKSLNKRENPMKIGRDMMENDDDSSVESLTDEQLPSLMAASWFSSWSFSSSDTAKQNNQLLSKKPKRSAIKKSDSSRQQQPIHTSRSVSFQSLKIREYNMTLGDHPNSSSGPPIQLDWTHANEKELDLEKYESARLPRRKRKQLKMSYQKREKILEREGFTMDSIKEAWIECVKIRQQRYETLMQGVMSTKVEEAW
eukprot:CAMPEP_0202453004 /NCGR_PEP_ID=MMETSP1360-20130828/11091_1 /ASSEMBLY_ACC=CAM_ASM_000848 /TAXON_ID=515479 /ORGANISM="Licmophora paradoxa, Strain CCMP2313" /LENGTH=244 /DNA_ID=CAMNT_0049071993 /DNA_START=84 /DNA_END=815 /DNA_ORIENTATION=+